MPLDVVTQLCALLHECVFLCVSVLTRVSLTLLVYVESHTDRESVRSHTREKDVLFFVASMTLDLHLTLLLALNRDT